MSLFYICSETNCNRKYKTENKLVGHLLQVHKIISTQIHEPVEITKENKKNIENMKNNIKQIEQRESLIKEIEIKKQLELIAKREAEDLYRQQQIEKWKLIEAQKLRLQDEEFRHDQINFDKLKLLKDEKLKQEEKLINDKINFNKRVQEQYKIRSSFDIVTSLLINSIEKEQSEKKLICSICLDHDANAAVVPCGHSNFCYECIKSHEINSKECPICRNEIMMVVKLYS